MSTSRIEISKIVRPDQQISAPVRLNLPQQNPNIVVINTTQKKRNLNVTF